MTDQPKPDSPKIEVLSTVAVLKDLRIAIAAADKETEAAAAIQTRVDTLLKQIAFYERGMDFARTRIVRLLMAQLRHAEAVCADDYVSKVDDALIELKEKNKKEEAAAAPGKGAP
jgi:hypothetical protein